VTDDGTPVLSDFEDVTITVGSVNRPPVLAPIGSQSVNENELLEITISGTDPDPGDVLTYSASGLPTGASFDPATQTFSWTPGFGSAGNYTVTFTVTDDGTPVLNDFEDVTITVGTASIVSVSFQDGMDGYSGTRDTKLMSQDPDTNFGDASKLEIDGSPFRSSLLYWDLTSIPQGSVVHSVDVTVNITNASGHVYDFYKSLRPWVESEATWNEYTFGLPWETDGSDGFSDRDSTVLGSISGSKGLATVSLNAQGVATVQAWVDDPSSNHGFIILNYINAKNGLDFSSRENGTASNRPKLTVTYSVGSP
jgi:hypothetical protein